MCVINSQCRSYDLNSCSNIDEYFCRKRVVFREPHRPVLISVSGIFWLIHQPMARWSGDHEKALFDLWPLRQDFIFHSPSSFQERHSDRHKESRSNLRLPSQSATYTTVSAWHHLPEKLILDSCGYEATVSPALLTSTRKRDALFLWSNFDTKSTPVLFGICRCILSASIVKL